MTAPLPPPGWYPDPGGATTQRYFDGTKWTDQLTPLNPPSGPGPLPPSKPQPELPAVVKSPRPFVIMAIAGPVTFIVAFILMQLAYGAADGAGSGSHWLVVIGYVLFVILLASLVATIVGIIGTVVWGVRQFRSR